MQRALVADDQTWVELENGRLTATSPATIAGCIEVRGVGIVPITSVPSAEARLMVDLVGVGQVERLPAADTTETLLGQRLPLRRLVALEASAPLKLAIMMMSLTQ